MHLPPSSDRPQPPDAAEAPDRPEPPDAADAIEAPGLPEPGHRDEPGSTVSGHAGARPPAGTRPTTVGRPATVAIPVRALEGAKSRLGGVLDAEERRDLVERLLRRTVAAAIATPGVTDVIVVSPDPGVLSIAAAAGARPLPQRSRGLNAAFQEAREAAAGERLLLLPGDLPAITSGDLARVLAEGDRAGRPSVVLVPDRHRRGTNALLLDPPDAIDPAFGGDSRTGHAWLAESADLPFVELGGLLELDLDTPEDLLLAEANGARPTAGTGPGSEAGGSTGPGAVTGVGRGR